MRHLLLVAFTSGIAAITWAGVAHGRINTQEALTMPGKSSKTSEVAPVDGMLFPTDLREREWETFRARGFSQPVVGVIYRDGGGMPYAGISASEVAPIEEAHWPPIRECGVPLGGIGTGYATLRLDGRFGGWSIYNNLVNPDTGVELIWWNTPVPQPRNVDLPFLGLAVGGKSTVLSLDGLEGADGVEQIHYWGHYPVADLEYELDGPVSVGLRAWTPFIPGDAADSNTPGAVFEVHLRNSSQTTQRGTVAFSFPGPDQTETRHNTRRFGTHFGRESVTGDFSGVVVSTVVKDLASDWMPFGYALGVVGPESIRTGGALGDKGAAWAGIEDGLPEVESTEEPGSAVAVDFALEPGETRVVRFVLAWYAPFWPPRHRYINMYYQRFKGPLEIAERLATEHEALLDRVLAWQQVVYSEEELPACLRDHLVNCLCLMAKGSSYVWLPGAMPGDGLLTLVEGAGTIPSREPLVASAWGDYPITYFFPELRRGNLWMFASYQLNDGRVPITIGVHEFDLPHHGHDMVTGFFFTEMVDRLWQSAGDDQVVRDFYPSVKRAIDFLMSSRSYFDDGLLSVDPRNVGRGQPFDSWLWRGEAPYISGHWLSALRSAERMAEEVGDAAFAQECRNWVGRGSQAMEETLWNDQTGSYYAYVGPGTEFRSDTIHAYQLEGSLSSAHLGLPEVFPADRLSTTLDTIERLCVKPIPVGAANAMRPDGTPDTTGGVDSEGIFPSHNALLAALYAYQGDHELAEEILEQMLRNLVLDHPLAWDFPQGFFRQDGAVPRGSGNMFGMASWAVPPALFGQTIREFCSPGGFAHRVMQAAKGGSAGRE